MHNNSNEITPVETRLELMLIAMPRRLKESLSQERLEHCRKLCKESYCREVERLLPKEWDTWARRVVALMMASGRTLEQAIAKLNEPY